MTATTQQAQGADIAFLSSKARSIRATCIQMAHDGREGHLSSSLSYVDILTALFYRWLCISPDSVNDPHRDRFVLSKGHGCTAYYAMLADRGFIPRRDLLRYNQEYGPLPNHPCIHALPGIEMSAGSLGHGLGFATGLLYAMRLRGSAGRVVVLLGDGECNEGSIWEAAMVACAQRLDRLLAIVDYNGIQAVGKSDEIAGHTSLEEKFRSFGWNSQTVDGTNIGVILEALDKCSIGQGKPCAIIARTRMGISFMEHDVLWHYRKPSDDDVRRALKELGVPPLQWDK